jgi:hypothetical protein
VQTFRSHLSDCVCARFSAILAGSGPQTCRGRAMDDPKSLRQTILAALISGTVVATVVGALLKFHFDTSFEEFKSAHNRDETVLTQLVGPVVMLLDRTEAVAKRYGERSTRRTFGDADLLRASNEAMRDLLIFKGYLIPAALLKDAHCLVVHYTVQRIKAEMARAAD